MGYVYILELANGRWYVGSTKDVDNRLEQHKNGEVKSTRYIRPITLVYVRFFESQKQARQVEYRLKKQKSKRIVQMFVDEKLELPNLG